MVAGSFEKSEATLTSLIIVQQILLIFWKNPTCMLLLGTCTFIKFLKNFLPTYLLRSTLILILEKSCPKVNISCKFCQFHEFEYFLVNLIVYQNIFGITNTIIWCCLCNSLKFFYLRIY